MFPPNAAIGSLPKSWRYVVVTCALTWLGNPLWENLVVLQVAVYLQSGGKGSCREQKLSSQSGDHEVQEDSRKSWWGQSQGDNDLPHEEDLRFLARAHPKCWTTALLQRTGTIFVTTHNGGELNKVALILAVNETLYIPNGMWWRKHRHFTP